MNHEVDPTLKAAMEALGWEDYLSPRETQVSKSNRRDSQRSNNSSSKVDSLTWKSFPKKLVGQDLGAPGVLPAAEFLRSRTPRSDHQRGR